MLKSPDLRFEIFKETISHIVERLQVKGVSLVIALDQENSYEGICGNVHNSPKYLLHKYLCSDKHGEYVLSSDSIKIAGCGEAKEGVLLTLIVIRHTWSSSHLIRLLSDKNYYPYCWADVILWIERGLSLRGRMILSNRPYIASLVLSANRWGSKHPDSRFHSQSTKEIYNFATSN